MLRLLNRLFQTQKRICVYLPSNPDAVVNYFAPVSMCVYRCKSGIHSGVKCSSSLEETIGIAVPSLYPWLPTSYWKRIYDRYSINNMHPSGKPVLVVTHGEVLALVDDAVPAGTWVGVDSHKRGLVEYSSGEVVGFTLEEVPASGSLAKIFVFPRYINPKPGN